MASLRFLVDEDVDVAVIELLRARGHEVREVRELFGERSDDRDNMAWARATIAIYLTCDWKYAGPRRTLSTRSAVLVLRDLHIHQLDRLTDLVDVVEREATIIGLPRFFMWIERDRYWVGR